MYIYNVTTMVQHGVHQQWLQWMQQIHIPEVMKTGCFTNFRLVKLLDTDDAEGVTYATQYFAESKAMYNRYLEKHDNNLRNEALHKWGNTTFGFRSLMQIIA